MAKKRDTAAFFQFMEERNARVAKIQAQETQMLADDEVGADPERVRRQRERREKLGQLRAIPHPRRTRQVRNVFGYIDLS